MFPIFLLLVIGSITFMVIVGVVLGTAVLIVVKRFLFEKILGRSPIWLVLSIVVFTLYSFILTIGTIDSFYGGNALEGVAALAYLVLMVGAVYTTVKVSRNPLELCKSCLAIKLEGMTLHQFLNRKIFKSFDGKSILLFHLFTHNGCDSCKQTAKSHLQYFVNANKIAFDVEQYYDNCRKP